MSYDLSLLVLTKGKQGNEVTEWILLVTLPKHAGGGYHWLLSENGPKTGNLPYRRAIYEQDGLPTGRTKVYHLAHLSEVQYYEVLMSKWEETLPGPNKHFLVRVMDRLATANLISRSLVDKWKKRATYSPPELWHFPKGMSNVDESFFKNGKHEDHMALYLVA